MSLNVSLTDVIIRDLEGLTDWRRLVVGVAALQAVTVGFSGGSGAVWGGYNAILAGVTPHTVIQPSRQPTDELGRQSESQSQSQSHRVGVRVGVRVGEQSRSHRPASCASSEPPRHRAEVRIIFKRGHPNYEPKCFGDD